MNWILAFSLSMVTVSLTAQAQQQPDLWAQKAAQERAAAAKLLQSRVTREQQKLLSGLQNLPSGLNASTAQCSDGWQNSDYVNKVADVCNARGCMSLYARQPENFTGFLFTCHFYLNNGSQCAAQGFASPRFGFAVFCVTPQLKDMPRRLIYTD